MMESGKTDGGSPRFIDDPNRNKRSKEASQAEVMFRRRLKIIQYLQAGHPNLESLANHCGCHIRTIQRDMTNYAVAVMSSISTRRRNGSKFRRIFYSR